MPRFRLRRYSALEWYTDNPILAEGEPALEKDTFNLKVGDGVRSWRDLPYVNNAQLQSANPTGMVVAFAGTTAPSGWLLCTGGTVSRTTYADLFDTIGTTYGSGDGSTTFNLPDLRNRVAVGTGASPFGAVGATTGAQSVELATANLPSHQHGLGGHTHTASTETVSAHSHSIDHDHGSVASGAGSAHSHTAGTEADHSHRLGLIGESDLKSLPAGTQTVLVKRDDFAGDYQSDWDGEHSHSISNESAHTHSVNLPSYSGSSGSAGGHDHSVTVNAASGNTGSTGSGTPVSVVQPSLALNYIIKV